MEAKKSEPEKKLTGEQIVQKQLDEVNAVFKKMDLSGLINKRPKKKP